MFHIGIWRQSWSCRTWRTWPIWIGQRCRSFLSTCLGSAILPFSLLVLSSHSWTCDLVFQLCHFDPTLSCICCSTFYPSNCSSSSNCIPILHQGSHTLSSLTELHNKFVYRFSYRKVLSCPLLYQALGPYKAEQMGWFLLVNYHFGSSELILLFLDLHCSLHLSMDRLFGMAQSSRRQSCPRCLSRCSC